MCLYTYVCVYGTLHWLTTCCCPGVQQWLYHAEKAQNPIVVQSVRVGVSSVPLWCWCPRGWHGELLLFSLLCWNPKEFGSNNSERISRQQDRWALYLRLRTSRHKWTFPSFSEFFFVGYHQVWPRFSMGLLPSSSLIKKLPHKCAQKLRF